MERERAIKREKNREREGEREGERERERERTAADRKQPGALSIMKIPPPLGLFYGPASMIGLHRLQRLH